MLLKLFPLIAIAAAGSGYLLPELISPAKTAIVPLLMLVMLSMGLTLRLEDFTSVARYKKAMAIGLVLQFSVMPITALLVSKLFSLSTELTIGMLLVGTVAGGTASNVMTYLARGNVALSVSMTALSTLASVALTPLLMLVLVGSSIEVPAVNMLKSLAIIIVLPISAGVVLNTLVNNLVSSLKPALAPLAILVIATIIAIVVALNADRIGSIGLAALIAPLIHNLVGLLVGYQAAKALGFEKSVCRTLAIEVGMQNSGLATALALKFFTPLSAVPGAIFSVWLNVTGSLFASILGNSLHKTEETIPHQR